MNGKELIENIFTEEEFEEIGRKDGFTFEWTANDHPPLHLHILKGGRKCGDGLTIGKVVITQNRPKTIADIKLLKLVGRGVMTDKAKQIVVDKEFNRRKVPLFRVVHRRLLRTISD